MMKLIGSATSPYVRKVRIVMAEKKLDYHFLRAEVKTWEALADGVMDATLLARMEATWSGRSAEQRCDAWMARQMDKIDNALQAMNKGLGDKAYCSGVHFSLSDVAVGCALDYVDFRFPQVEWHNHYPKLAKLQEKLKLRPSFIDTQAS